MISPCVSSLPRGGRIVSVLAIGFVAAAWLSADVAPAQTPMRGPPLALRPSTTIPFPQPGSIIFGVPVGGAGGPLAPEIGQRFVSQLLPGKPVIPLLNNGSLSVWLNPVPQFPNTIQYTYFASIPVGDRLGKNGVVYDPELTNNIGFSPTLPQSAANQTFGNFTFPSIPPISNAVAGFGGNQFARQRLLNQYYYALAVAAAAQMAAPVPAPAFNGFPGFAGFANPTAPVNTGGFGAGFGIPAAPLTDRDRNKATDKDENEKN